MGMGMGRGNAAAGHFFHIRGCPEVLGAAGCQANRAAHPLPGPLPVSHRPRASGEERAADTHILQPGSISGSEEELCPGGGHYVK